MASILWHDIPTSLKNLNVYQFSNQIKLYLFSEQLEISMNMAKNSRHRWAVLFSRVHNPSINDFLAVTSYWFTVAMEEIEFYFSSRRAGHQWLQRRVEF